MRKMIVCIILIATLTFVACHKKDPQTMSMPSDFAISFSYGMNDNRLNFLDTYKGIIQKDLISDGIATVDYVVPKDDLKEIYAQICEFKINKITKSMTSENLAFMNSGIRIIPCTKYYIAFTAEGVEYNITGDETATSYINKNKEAKNFCTFISYMLDYISSTEEYKSLPKANGAYE